MRRYFNKIDINGDGTVTKKELKMFLKSIRAGNITDDEIDKILYSVDLNLDGVMDFNEFVKASVQANFDPNYQEEIK